LARSALGRILNDRPSVDVENLRPRFIFFTGQP
jgi:hypothetical protein